MMEFLHNWFTLWKIRVNPAKSAHITFTTRRVTCLPIFLHTTPIPVKHDVKYLGLHLDCQLTWRKHIQTKRQHLDLKLRTMSWLLGRRSQLSLPNQLLLYKCILKPVWTYGIQLWGCAKPSHMQIHQRLQSHSRLAGHRNALVATLSMPPNVAWHLKHRWPSDLHIVTGD